MGRGDAAARVRVEGGAHPPAECARAIEVAEARAAETGGWTGARHAEAATTDMALKDVPELLEWFNGRLKSTLFPMLAARYPDKISSPDVIRAHDAFVVKRAAASSRTLQLVFKNTSTRVFRKTGYQKKHPSFET